MDIGATPIVGIGASAGGLEALTRFVQAIPKDSGAAYVVIQHLAPDHPSIMHKLLSEHALIPVLSITQGQRIAPNKVYVIPPGPFLSIKNGRFHLEDHPRESGVRSPIDRFFASLGEQVGRNAFGVILSGTGSDGTLGIRAIKAAGGVTMVQDSESAQFSGMPDSAVATGEVDFVLPADDMAEQIVDILDRRSYYEQSEQRNELFEAIESRLPDFLEKLDKDDDGQRFSGYKPGTLIRRIQRRMILTRGQDPDTYLQTLEDSPAERHRLMQDFLIGVTEFFRDPKSFDALAEKVLVPLLERGTDKLRIWVPGCSSGEEVYSIAMLIHEAMSKTGKRPNVQIFGTDIDIGALHHARHGRYTETTMKGVSETRRKAFFVQEQGVWQMRPHLREMCIFAPHNLIDDPPFSRLDLISCRNLMIYLNADSQSEIIPRFHYALNPGGFLALGPSESLGKNEKFFDPLDRNLRLFRRNDTVSTGFTATRVSPLRGSPLSREHTTTPPMPTIPAAHMGQTTGGEARYDDAFLHHFAAPYCVLNARDEIVYLGQAMTRFARPAKGAPSAELDSFLAPELRRPAHSVLAACRDQKGPAEQRNVVVDMGNGDLKLYDLRAQPLERDEVMLVLSEVRQRESEALDLSTQSQDDRDLLERELSLTRRRLSDLQHEFEGGEQQLRSANEELLSMNEELQSSNEELETSREELQSINEELETINAELTENNKQLNRANSNLHNLLESTNIATLFLDRHSLVRLFTPAATSLFSLQERDIGRSIFDLAAKVEYRELAADIAKVSDDLQPIEREVRLPETDSTFSARLRPYRTIDDRLDGCVVTFVDITERKKAEQQIEENARLLSLQFAELETLYDTAPVGLGLLDPDLRFTRINDTLAELSGFSAEDHLGKQLAEVLPDISDDVQPLLEKAREGTASHNVQLSAATPTNPDITRHWTGDFYPVRSDEDILGVGIVLHEITEQRKLESDAREAEAKMRRLFDQAPANIAIFEGPDHKFIYSNPTNTATIQVENVLGRPLREVLPTLEEQGVIRLFDHLYETGEPLEIDSLASDLSHDGTRRHHFRQTLQPWFDGDGNIGGVMAFNLDISAEVEARREAETARALTDTVLNSLESFVGLLAPDGTLEMANQPALDAGGLSSEDVLGLKFWDCYWWSYDPEVQDRLKDAIHRACAGETVQYDEWIRVAEDERVCIDFRLVPSIDEEGRVTKLIPSGTDITERTKAQERKDVLMAELQHRVKNVLATVQSIMRFTARKSASKTEMVETLQHRLAAIGRTHDVLTRQDWQGCHLCDLITDEFSPYSGDDKARFSYDGPSLFLPPAQAMSLGLALHELVTNAAKYGALSTPDGHVAIRVTQERGTIRSLDWQEKGGPPIDPPTRSGFGSFLMENVLSAELDAKIKVEFRREGLHFHLEVEE